MAGTCKFCGYSGTQEEIMEHAGKCPVLNGDYHPLEFSLKEMNTLREQYHTLCDIAPEFLEPKDHELGKLITEYCVKSAIPGAAGNCPVRGSNASKSN